MLQIAKENGSIMLQLGLGSVQAQGKRSVSRFRLSYSLGSGHGTVLGYIAKKRVHGMHERW
jgi:hypothetical protein